tara:strand:- start:1025 stop:1297 length:273 start_codon:yes stop_codon:yes gene_type:complete
MIFIIIASMLFSMSTPVVEYAPVAKPHSKKADTELLRLQVEKLRLEIELKKINEKKSKKSKKSVKTQEPEESKEDPKEFEGIDTSEVDDQ